MTAEVRRYLYGTGIALEHEIRLREDLLIRPIKLNDDTDWLKSKAITQYEYGLLCAFAGGISFELEAVADNARDAATKVWNAQWDLILLSILRRTPISWLFQSVAPHNQNQTTHTRVTGHATHGPAWSRSLLFSTEDFDLYRALEHQFHTLLREDRFTHAASVAAMNYKEPKLSIRMAGIWSGIEALLGFDHELRFRIALAVARILETDELGRAGRFTDVKKLYDLRSKSVHGANTDPTALKYGVERSLKLLCELIVAFTRKGDVLTAKEADVIFLQG